MEASAKTLPGLKKTLLTVSFPSSPGDTELLQAMHLPPGHGINQRLLLPLLQPLFVVPQDKGAGFPRLFWETAPAWPWSMWVYHKTPLMKTAMH